MPAPRKPRETRVGLSDDELGQVRGPRTPRPGREDDSVVKLHPVYVLKLNLNPVDMGRKPVAEMWLYPDGSRSAP